RDVQLALAREYGYDGWTSLKAAVESRRAGDEAAPQPEPLTALLAAAARGEKARITELLDEQPDLASQRGFLRGHTGRRTALHFAVGGEHEEIINLLLARGAD